MRLVQELPPGAQLERISDAVDEVNAIKGQWNAASEFDQTKEKTAFRAYETAVDSVKSFYAEQHAKQTVAFNLKARIAFRTRDKNRCRLSVWDAIEKLNELIDESDPDTSLSQIEHLLQTAEAMRRDGKPEWMQVVGLTHDLGKLLYFFGSNGQWDVVGDTFVVGCKFDKRIIYHNTFAHNPDSRDPVYSTEEGIYSAGCGLDNVMLSWGHDEYLYHVFKEQSTLPEEGLAMIRYHSFYPWHREGAYHQFMEPRDFKHLEAVRAFNPYDLYSKSDKPPVVEDLREYYQSLIAKFFPEVISF